ncbi:hypothetical protein JCM33374_g6132 [Metschnikowia sp. JCM 33374]|nr:hypothetical protein JCM33374_g6132 [Metschnikowia sp. JCM 33374]
MQTWTPTPMDLLCWNRGQKRPSRLSGRLQSRPAAPRPKLPHNSIFHEYNSLLDVAQDTHSNEVNCERKLAIASQYKGPQIGFSILLSEQSINYVKSKLAPEHHRLVIPMQTIPMYLYASKKAFHSIWSEPQIQTAESIAKLRAGCFPEEAFIDEILRLFHSLYFANFICSVDYVRSLFDKYYANKASSQPDPKVLSYSELMIMSLVMVMCVTAYVDIKNSASSSEQNYPKISQFSLTELVAFQESVFKNALFYYHRICTVSEGLATIQALILMAIHLETSWVISDLNFSLTSMAVRYAQDMGLHRLDSAGNLSPEEKENRARVWRACQHFDIEVCYRSGKPPSVNLLDVSLDNLLFQETPAATSPNFEQQTLCNEYDKLAYIRCYTYMKLFSAQIKYDSLSNIQEVVSTINADMVRLAESTNHVIRPRFFNDPNFDTLLELFTNSTKPAHTEMVIGIHLTFFNHMMTVNRVPWAVASDTNDPSTHENSKFRRLSLDSARTILHLIRTLEHSSTSILSFNWLVTYPFSAITNLLSNCLNYPDDPEVLKDLSLLIDVSLNTFGKIGSRAEEETNRLFYIRVRMADILIKVIMRVVITIVDQTCGTNILTSNPTLLEHLQMVEKKYPRFYRPLKGSNNIQHYVSTHPGNHVSPSNSSSKSPYIDGINKVSPTNTSSMASMNSEVEQAPPFSPGLSALEAIDFLEFGDKLETSAYGNPFMDNEDYVSLPNFFFDNGL